jgi:hypothetical protein
MTDMMTLSRLTVSDKMANQHNVVKDEYKSPSGKFSQLIVELATRNPLWNFVITDVRPYDKSVQTVTAYQHGENLGYIEWDYFRGEYGFEIGNERIERARERSRAYKTHDEKKALAAIKKTFSPKNVAERVLEAVKDAKKLLGEQSYHKRREHSTAEHAVEKHAVEFVKTIWAQYEAHMETQGKAHILEKWREVEVEMKTLDELSSAFEKGRSSLVIKTDGQYIVKTGDKVEIMDDTTLPADMRAKLGMLKLVDDEHFITNIGGKVNAEVFVLAPNEEGEGK